MSNKVAKGKMIASIIGIALASILIIIAFCGRYFNSGFRLFANFFVGTFGMAFYGLMAAVIAACSLILAGKTIKIPAKYVVFFALLFLSIVLFVHTLTTVYLPKDDFSKYVGYVYNYYGDSFGVPTFGGVLFGIISYALQRALTIYGATIVIVGIMVWSLIVVAEFFYSYFSGRLKLASYSDSTTRQLPEDIEISEKTSQITRDPSDTSGAPSAWDILRGTRNIDEYDGGERPQTTKRYDVADQTELNPSSMTQAQVKDILFGKGVDRQVSSNTTTGRNYFDTKKQEKIAPEDESMAPLDGYTSLTDKTVDSDGEDYSADWKASDPAEEKADKEPYADSTDIPDVPKAEETPKEMLSEKTITEVSDKTEEEYSKDADDTLDFTEIIDVDQPDDNPADNFDSDEFGTSQNERIVSPDNDADEENVEEEDPNELVPVYKETPFGDKGVQLGFDLVSKGDLAEVQSKIHQYGEYVKPDIDLLTQGVIADDFEADDRQYNASRIVTKFSVYGIKVENVDIIVGPSITRYTFKVLSEKTRMSEFKQYVDDIKACIEASGDIRIEAPLHGTSLVGIEVPNKVPTPVKLRTLLESNDYINAKGSLVFGIGVDITGKPIIADLADMPHLLVAGTTGSGKSVSLHCLIVSLLYKYGPEYVRFLMVDPKVELTKYTGLPHMLTRDAITTVNDALAGMDYLIQEMEARYDLLRKKKVSKISEYNSRINPQIEQKLPYLVFIVDELADLMANNKKAVENKIVRLAQKSRAAGIHIVLATQRPSVDVVTGIIKANLPCRMALKVAQSTDSQTILGYGGAEKLLGKGDMLFMNSGSNTAERLQGAFVHTDEIRDIVEFLSQSNPSYYDDAISKSIFVSQQEQEIEEDVSASINKVEQLDPYCKKALRYWLEKNKGKASIASIQRGLKIGFNRAGRIMEQLQRLKYVEEPDASEAGNKPLMVLVTLEDLDELFPDMDDSY